jgi:hypothetical protein
MNIAKSRTVSKSFLVLRLSRLVVSVKLRLSGCHLQGGCVFIVINQYAVTLKMVLLKLWTPVDIRRGLSPKAEVSHLKLVFEAHLSKW